MLLTFVSAQTFFFAAIVLTLRPLHESGLVTAEFIAIILVTSWVAALLGLLVSAYASSDDQATGVIPLLLVPQLLFSGAIVQSQDMTVVVRLISLLVPARWSFAAAGHAINIQKGSTTIRSLCALATTGSTSSRSLSWSSFASRVYSQWAFSLASPPCSCAQANDVTPPAGARGVHHSGERSQRSRRTWLGAALVRCRLPTSVDAAPRHSARPPIVAALGCGHIASSPFRVGQIAALAYLPTPRRSRAPAPRRVPITDTPPEGGDHRSLSETGQRT